MRILVVGGSLALLAAVAEAQVDITVALAQSEAVSATIVSHEIRRLAKVEMTVQPAGATWDQLVWKAGPATSVAPPLGNDGDNQRTQQVVLTMLAEQNQQILMEGDIDSPNGITGLLVKVTWENGVTGESWLTKMPFANTWSATISPFEVPVVVPPGPPAEPVYLSWVPPTQNEDGTPYTDARGYKVYLGTTSHVYSQMFPVYDPATNYLTVQNLAVGATYFFAATAISFADEESIFSNEVSYVPVVATVDPAPPTGFKATGVSSINTAYTINTVANAMVKVAVGTIATGTVCDATQHVNVWGTQPDDQVDLYLVPRGTPGLQLIAGVDPDVVYARCAQ